MSATCYGSSTQQAKSRRDRYLQGDSTFVSPWSVHYFSLKIKKAPGHNPPEAPLEVAESQNSILKATWIVLGLYTSWAKPKLPAVISPCTLCRLVRLNRL